MSSKTHTERALITLRQRVLNGSIAGGERLYEVALANDLEISRTPVRAALSKLAEEGLLERIAGGGFKARRFEMRDVLDTIELRGTLEGTAARLAAERGITPEHQKEGEVILREIDRILEAEEIDMDLYAKENSKFHDLMARMAGSRVIRHEIERVTALPFASPSAFLDDESQVTRFRKTLTMAQEQHRAILGAIGAREGSRAEFLAREHARTARRNAHRLVTERQSSEGGAASLALVSK
ncbi:GntR family transcriptional regulator [Roseivivax sp. GX 12232]|uniref:GntR family transcriptional regulator n=1 Tax=Roseivivax sp. GX 12232 TaxID=2900547 RepID=UPI001E4788A5|nr:GntR family transcriptional regulator [Roseivivax sp. GX 12232]MCE0507257.1 GntR family transcriptional regulator [Roseivivax sp. GX 12232]